MDGRHPRKRVQNPAYRSTRPSLPWSARFTASELAIETPVLVDVSQFWWAFDGLATAQTAQRWPGWDPHSIDGYRLVRLVVAPLSQLTVNSRWVVPCASCQNCAIGCTDCACWPSRSASASAPLARSTSARLCRVAAVA